MKIVPTIFREYDIRGIVDTALNQNTIQEYEKWYGKFPGVTLTTDTARAIAGVYGTIIKEAGGNRVAVGYELRPGAGELKKAFIEGLLAAGVDVVDIGIALTPIVYFCGATQKFDGAVNITGSHNIYFYNGFKLMKRNVVPIYGEEIQRLKERVMSDDYTKDQKGTYETAEAFSSYRDYFLSHIGLERKLKIVIDSGNGSAGIFAPKLFEDLGCEVIELYSEPDATFPNHIPDPGQPQNMKDLGEKVIEAEGDLGIAFDADGDRVGFVDERGRYMEADHIFLILAKEFLSRNPGKKVLFDMRGSAVIEELIPQYGGALVMHRAGHGPIKATLHKDHEIILGGEQTGHFYFSDGYFRIDDGMWTAGQILQIFSKTNGLFSDLFKNIPKRIRTPEIKLPCADEIKFEVMEKIKNDLSSRYPSLLTEGVRIKITETSWGIIRGSNTSPYLSVLAEGATDHEVIEVKNILADELEKFPEIGDKLNREAVATLTGRLGWV